VAIQQIITSTPGTIFRGSASVEGADADALEAALADMSATFSDDCVSGRSGMGHNGHEHRSRVLDEMTEQLATLRETNKRATF
jgi:uncharacterized protein (DUF885 family)